MNQSLDILQQHLIDPELCIRCNNCEEHCSSGAISNNGINYVVDAALCNACRDCVPDCPTGAIDNWRPVLKSAPYTLDDQFQWSALPAPGPALADWAATARTASATGRGAPASAATPVENRYTREAPLRARVRLSRRLTAQNSSEIRHIELEVGPDFPFLEGQSIGVLPPGQDAQGRRWPMRLYSIASSRQGEDLQPGVLALTVKRVLEDHAGQPYRGLCSNHLCDQGPGDVVDVLGPFGASFLLPEDPQARLLLICTGTGIAPMRGMLQERWARRAQLQGDQALFYGGRTPQELPYEQELVQWPTEFLERHLAYSRSPQYPKAYVQDLLRQQHALVAQRLADERTHIYLCGLKGMEDGVLQAFRDIGAQYGLVWSALEPNYKAEGRLHIETY